MIAYYEILWRCETCSVLQFTATPVARIGNPAERLSPPCVGVNLWEGSYSRTQVSSEHELARMVPIHVRAIESPGV